MTMLIKTNLTSFITSVTFIFITQDLPAQDNPQITPLDDINVTATRIEKKADEIPASVGVIEKRDIQFAAQQTGLDESLVKMPGIFMQNRYNFAQDLRISIRGFGARSSFGIRGIKVLVDGIPESTPDGQSNVDSIDIGSSGRMQVIRGPVSSLYGNASGGAIIIESEKPPETPFISIRPSYGGNGFQKHQVKFGGKQEKLDYLVNISDLDYDGYRDHSHTKSTLLNSKFGFAIDDSSKLTAILNVTDSPIADDAGGLTVEEVSEDPSQARDKNVTVDSGEALEQERFGLIYEKTLSNSDKLTLRNYYIWRDLDIRIPAGRFGEGINLQRFAAGGGVQYTRKHILADLDNRITAGIDLDNQDDERQRFNLDGLGVGDQTQDQDEEVSSLGVYIQDELRLSDKAELTFGGRYDRVKFDVTDNFLSDGDDSGDRTFDEFSPSVALRYSPIASLNYYANISRSFETPTARELGNPDGGGFNQELKPQTATNYEIGVKGNFSETSQYEVALFHINVDDELVPFEVDGETFYENAGESRRQGLELSLSMQPFDGLNASLAYTYSNFEFREFIDDDNNDFSGKTIPGVPENLLHVDISYMHTSGLYGQFDILYADTIFANNDNSVESEAYTVANLKLGISHFIGNWELAPFLGVNNIFDEEYNSNIRINAFGSRYYEPAPDRNLYAGIELRYDFL
ncbi:MAG: TonB-dependent receptor [Candidatus Thiodiazotropha sp. (ex Cardiolucina cf. quadrata)]|nr:TonB-dependent receptor [Candidatus Thiodiazotropha sp. (ex Cardiolucina cf. quadrata)]